MGMEVQFDFEVPPVDEFARRLCQQVETNIENSRREERVQRKRRELRERIKVQIVTSPYTMTPTSSIIDCNRRDSMALPLERGTFTPFQKIPFRKCIAETDRRNVPDLRPFSSSQFGPTTKQLGFRTGSSVGFSEDRASSERKSDMSTRDDSRRPDTESLSSDSSFSLLCSPPTQSLSPIMGVATPSKASYALKDYTPESDESSTASTLQTINEDAYIHIRPPRHKSRGVVMDNADKDDVRSIEQMEYVQEEFFWIVDYRITEKIFDSDAFTFAGSRFKLTFGPNISSNPRNSNGYSLLLALAQSHGEAYISCEFSVHGLLRPTFCRKCSKNLHFTSRSSVYRGYKHFMGPELLSYLENGTFTFSVTMKTYLGVKGELLGLPDPLGGKIGAVKGSADRDRDRDSDSEIASKSEAGFEEECRMDDIYPGQRDDYYYQTVSDFNRHNRNNASSSSDRPREKGGIMHNSNSCPAMIHS